MIHNDLRFLLSQKMSKEDILTFAKTINLYNCDKIFPFIANGNKELSANVAHLFLNTYKETEVWLTGQVAFIINIIQTTPHEKTQRLLLSILERLKLDATNIDIKFLDYCLNNIHSRKTACAIRVLSIKLAYKLSVEYPELLMELKMTLECLDSSTLNPSVACVKKNILRKLNTLLNDKTRVKS